MGARLRRSCACMVPEPRASEGSAEDLALRQIVPQGKSAPGFRKTGAGSCRPAIPEVSSPHGAERQTPRTALFRELLRALSSAPQRTPCRIPSAAVAPCAGGSRHPDLAPSPPRSRAQPPIAVRPVTDVMGSSLEGRGRSQGLWGEGATNGPGTKGEPAYNLRVRRVPEKNIGSCPVRSRGFRLPEELPAVLLP